MILVLRVIGKLVLFQLPSLLIIVEDPAKKQDVSKHQHKSKHNTHNIVEFFGVAQIRPEWSDQGMPGSKQTNECEASDLVDVQRSQVGNDGQRSVHDDPFEWNSGEQQSICCLKSEMWGLGVDCEDGKWNNGYQKDEEKGVDDVKARTTRGIAVGTDLSSFSGEMKLSCSEVPTTLYSFLWSKFPYKELTFGKFCVLSEFWKASSKMKSAAWRFNPVFHALSYS